MAFRAADRGCLYLSPFPLLLPSVTRFLNDRRCRSISFPVIWASPTSRHGSTWNNNLFHPSPFEKRYRRNKVEQPTLIIGKDGKRTSATRCDTEEIALTRVELCKGEYEPEHVMMSNSNAKLGESPVPALDAYGMARSAISSSGTSQPLSEQSQGKRHSIVSSGD